MMYLALASAAETLFVYDPGGLAPTMKEAAAAFEKQTGTKVELTAGTTPSWSGKAQESADVILNSHFRTYKKSHFNLTQIPSGFVLMVDALFEAVLLRMRPQ